MPLDSETVDTLISETAASERSISRDGNSLTSHSISELNQLRKDLKAEAATEQAVSKPGLGLRMQSITPVYR